MDEAGKAAGVFGDGEEHSGLRIRHSSELVIKLERQFGRILNVKERNLGLT